MNSRIVQICFFVLIVSCHSSEHKKISPVNWTEVSSVNVDSINGDLQTGLPTIDVGIYFPSNLDPDFEKITMEQVVEGFLSAKDIYKPTGVQLNLLWFKTGNIEDEFLSLQANVVPGVPSSEYNNMYQHNKRNPSKLTEKAMMAFESIVEREEENDRTIYLIILQDVFFPFLEVSEGRNWTMKTVRTGGLSFPTYSYPNTIPKRLRGVITLTNLSRPDRLRRTIAHEIGHKAINVSHEYKNIDPQHEVYAEGGLMIYGDGIAIGSGQENRFHLERLRLSPFIYTLDKNGKKLWNPDYEEGGHYYDPIYGKYVINFKGVPPINEDW